MKLIHTSDWHIGRSLYGRKRYEEYRSFLAWLADLIAGEQVNILLVAGDVFDNSTPGNRAQELYYQFLVEVAKTSCRHVIITAGNHDSPSFLNAPREVLRFLNVHVIGCITDSYHDEILVLKDTQGEPELIVCAVPYLRDRDIRKAEIGESPADKERKLVEGIKEHYQQVCAQAEQIRVQLGKMVPIVAMGHLFTTGGQTVEGDGVRNLYVGSLGQVGNDAFPACIDYLALGHLHMAQKVGGAENRRYSGSPLAMGFNEAARNKYVCQVVFHGRQPEVSLLPVPIFQNLEGISGDWKTIQHRLEELKTCGGNVWLEIIYNGAEIIGNLRERLDEIIEGTSLEILRVKNDRVLQQALSSINSEETLDDLDTIDVFMRCLDAHQIPEEQREELLGAYNEAVAALYEDGPEE